MSDLSAARAARRKMMLESPIYKVIPIIAVPMVISALIDSFYNLADTYFVSQLGTAATAAVGINNSLMHLIRAVGMGFGMGAASYSSRLLGARKYDEASSVVSTSLFTSIGFITIISAVVFIFREQAVSIMGATASSRQYSIDYANYILLAAPFTVINVVLSQALRAEGSTSYSMMGLVSGCIVNLVLDPIFITELGYGVAGAAIATAISKVISTIVLMIPYLRHKSLHSIALKHFTPKAQIYYEIARMGIPTFLRSSLMAVAFIITNKFAGGYGDSALAAVSVCNRVMIFIGSMVMGLGQGFQPVAGYCYGAKKYRRVRSAFWITSFYGLILCVLLGTGLFILAPKIVGLFTADDAEIISVGTYMVRIQCIVLPFHVWVMIINGVFQAMGRAVNAAILGLARQAICFIPSVIVMNVLFGLQGMIHAQPIADIMSLMIALPMLSVVMKELNQLALTETDSAPEEEYSEEISETERKIEESLSEDAF